MEDKRMAYAADKLFIIGTLLIAGTITGIIFDVKFLSVPAVLGVWFTLFGTWLEFKNSV